MARGKSVRLLAAIPAEYTADFLDRLDKRTVLGKAVSDRFEAVTTDLGGADALSHIKMGMVKRLLWLECVIEGIELQVAAGESVDVGTWTQLVNSWIGLARMLGLERKVRPIRSLRDHMAAAS